MEGSHSPPILGSTFLHQTIADTIGTLNECTIQRSEFPSDVLYSVINVL
jgi:hypothetical protein